MSNPVAQTPQRCPECGRLRKARQHRGGAHTWIPVEERCPAPGSSILFWTNEGTCEMGYFRADDGEPIRWECERTGPQDERIDFFEGQVTHWMPLPEAPHE
jgi:Protein of unknown function (DUF551)